MGAHHGTGLGQKVQLIGEDQVGLSRNETKIQVVQPPAGPNLHQVGGRGVSGIGTVYPINPAVDDRGTVSDADIDVVIASPLHHYIKIELTNTDPTINLIDLIVGLSSTFTLDLTNGVALSSLTFVPALTNAPTIDLTNSARNVLYIVGHRTASETRYEVMNAGSGGGGNVPNGTIENQHAEWDNGAGVWLAVANSTYGATGPFATGAFLNFANDVIWAAGRTGADDGNMELKWTTQDELDLTNSNETTVKLLLRSQHATEADALFLIQITTGDNGLAGLIATNNLAFTTDLSTTNMVLSPTKVLFGTDISLDTNEIFLDNDEDSGIVSTVDDTVQIFVNNTIRFAVQDTLTTIGTNTILQEGFKLTLDSDATEAAFRDIGHTGDPSSPASGDLYYNTTTNLYKFYNGTVWGNIAGAGSQTPWTSIIDGDGFQLIDVGAISWRDPSGIIPAATVHFIAVQSDSFVLNVPTADDFDFRENGVNFLTMDAAVATFTVGTFQANADIINLGIANDQINILGDMAMAGDIDMNTNFIQFDATTVPADPPATELRLFSDSTNSDHLSIRRIGSTVDLETVGTGANTALSNLASVAVNTDIISDSDGVDDLGSSSKFWDNTFTERLVFSTSSGTISPTAGAAEFYYSSATNQAVFNLPTGQTFFIMLNAVGIFTLNNNGLRLTTAVNLGFRHDVSPHGAHLEATGSGAALNSAGSSSLLEMQIGGTKEYSFSNTAFIVEDGNNLSFGASTGTKIGSSTSQKIGFWNSTPLVQQTVGSDTLANLYTLLRNIGILG